MEPDDELPVDVAEESYALHTERVTQALASRSGQILSTSAGGDVILLSPQVPQRKRKFDCEVTAAIAAEDGKIFVGAGDGSIRQVDLIVGDERIWVGPSGRRPTDLAYSSRTQRLAVANDDGTVTLFDVANWNVIWKPPVVAASGNASCVALSTDGGSLATFNENKTLVMWDVESRSIRYQKRFPGRCRDMKFSPQGDVLACGTDRVLLFDTLTGETLHSGPVGHSVWCLDFSRDGRFVASGHWDHGVRIFDRKSASYRVLRGHTDEVRELAFDWTGRTIVSVDASRWADCVRLWDLESGSGYGALPLPFPLQTPSLPQRERKPGLKLVIGEQLVAMIELGVNQATCYWCRIPLR